MVPYRIQCHESCILTSSKDDEGSEVVVSSLDCEAFGFGAMGGGFLLGGEGFLLGGRAEIRLEISQRISYQKELCIIHVDEQINTTSPHHLSLSRM